MFVCKACGLEKPANAYRVRKQGARVGQCRECENAYQREWSRRDPEKIRKRKRESMAKRRAEDPEKARAYAMAHHYRNHEASKATMRAYASRRFFWTRAMHLRGSGRADTKSIARLWWTQRGLCALTGRRLDRSAQLDHVLPKARGGTDAIGNLRWVCAGVNLMKRDLTDAELLELCGSVMAWIGRRIKLVDALEIQEAQSA